MQKDTMTVCGILPIFTKNVKGVQDDFLLIEMSTETHHDNVKCYCKTSGGGIIYVYLHTQRVTDDLIAMRAKVTVCKRKLCTITFCFAEGIGIQWSQQIQCNTYEMSLLAGIVRNKYRCVPHREFTERITSERMRPVAVLYTYKVLTFVTGRRIRFGNNDYT